jgi:hypothetical protein
MFRVTAFALMASALALLAAQSPEPVAAQGKKVVHPRVHQALRDLLRAREELKEGADIYGGHRVKAIEQTNEAISWVVKALESIGETIDGPTTVDPAIYKKYDHFPHMQHALRLLRDAGMNLKEAAPDFKGLKAEAGMATLRAVAEVEQGLEFAKSKK